MVSAKRLFVAACVAAIVFIAIAGCATPDVKIRIRPVTVELTSTPLPTTD